MSAENRSERRGPDLNQNLPPWLRSLIDKVTGTPQAYPTRDIPQPSTPHITPDAPFTRFINSKIDMVANADGRARLEREKIQKETEERRARELAEARAAEELHRQEALNKLIFEKEQRNKEARSLLKKFGIAEKLAQINNNYWAGRGHVAGISTNEGEILGYWLSFMSEEASEDIYEVNRVYRDPFHEHRLETYRRYRVVYSNTDLSVKVNHTQTELGVCLYVDSPVFPVYGVQLFDKNGRFNKDTDPALVQAFPILAHEVDGYKFVPRPQWPINLRIKPEGVGIKVDHPLAEQLLDEVLALDCLMRKKFGGFPHDIVNPKKETLYKALNEKERSGSPRLLRSEKTHICNCPSD